MARLSARTSVEPAQPSIRTGAYESSALAGVAASALCAFLLLFCAPAKAERSCPNEWRAEVVYTEGTVELAIPPRWIPLHAGARLCHGDIIRTGRYSRTTIRLPDGNGTLVSVHADTSLRLHAVNDTTDPWYDVVVKVLKGLVHAISRDPRFLAFDTPFVNAAIEGTELVVKVDPNGTTVDVIEGEVVMSNSMGVTTAVGGTSGFASRDRQPEAAAADVLRSIDWARQYARVIPGQLPPPDAVPAADDADSPAFYVRRAASRLRGGAVSEAEEDIRTALALDPSHGDALALRAVIALGQQERERAVDLARQAVETAPESAAAWLALSHAADASTDRRLARSSADTAVRIAPDQPYAWARVAELDAADGNYRGAREAAGRALEIDPGSAKAHMVLGFVELNSGEAAAAEAAFREAVQADGGDASARLGLSLALYRQGRTELGRREAENALSVEPTSSVLRGYMGIAYDDENRAKVGRTQLEIAKSLDASDPTGWYFDALRKQHENRLVEAMLDFRRAFDETGRRSVYGAEFALDENLPARSAGIGRLHSALGLERLGLISAWRAQFDDPTEYSGYRLAADLYGHRPRHQRARVNEVHQAIIRQPINVTPIQAQLTEARPFLHDVAGPSSLSFQEYHRLVREDGMSVQLSGVGAGRDTRGLDVAVNGLHDRVSYNLSLFDFSTEGFRENNGFDQRVVSALTQFRLGEATTLTAELRSNDVEKGDLALRFDPEMYSRSLREEESVDYLLFGLRTRTRSGTWLATAIAEEADVDVDGIGAFGQTGPTFGQTGSRRGTALDVQYVTDLGEWTIVSGARYLDQHQVDDLVDVPPILAAVLPADALHTSHDVVHGSVYAYGNVELSNSLRATVGASIEEIENYQESRRRFGPKLGMMWDAAPRTTVRAAVFRALQPPFVSKHSIQPTLEPTHVAGLNQLYFGSQGEDVWRYGLAVDRVFTETLFGGIELSRRDVDMPYLKVDPANSVPLVHRVQRDERSHFAYVYWLPTSSISFSASYEYDEFDAGETRLPEGFHTLETHRVPLRFTYSHPSGLGVGVETRFVDQSGYFNFLSDTERPPEYGEDRFWSVDLSLSYRLPSKRGQLSWKVLNATDEEFRFQDIDPENPRILPRRMMQMAFTLSY